MSKYKTKPQEYTGETLSLEVTVEGVPYPAGSILMTDADGKQFILTPDEVADDFDEVKPRTRTASTSTTPQVPPSNPKA